MAKKDKYYTYALIAVFVLTVVIRIYISLQTPNLTYDGYFTARQVEAIKNSGLPTYSDKLSYSGRFFIFHPAYYYLLTPFAMLIGTDMALKIIPNILASTLIFVTFLIVLHITKNRIAALISGIASATIPAFFSTTINSASSYSFTLPLIMYMMYCFMKMKEKIFLNRFIVLAFVLSLTSAIAFLLVLSLVIYLILTKLEYKTENRKEIEMILFTTFLVIWVNIVMFKKAFLAHSYGLIWQNIPSQILDNLFKEVSAVDAVTGIGLIPLMFGIFAIYQDMLKEKNRNTYLLMAFALSVALLLWFKMITLTTGLIFLGAILIPLFGQTLNRLLKYLNKTKISRTKPFFIAIILLLILLTSTIPSIVKSLDSIKGSVSQDDIEALKFLRENTEENSVVLSTIKEGDLITAIAKRKNVADDNFIMIRNPDEIFEDIQTIYTSILKTRAVELLNKYQVNYIYFSEKAKKEFGIEELKFADEDCFELVYDKKIKIYKTLCEIKTAE